MFVLTCWINVHHRIILLFRVQQHTTSFVNDLLPFLRTTCHRVWRGRNDAQWSCTDTSTMTKHYFEGMIQHYFQAAAREQHCYERLLRKLVLDCRLVQGVLRCWLGFQSRVWNKIKKGSEYWTSLVFICVVSSFWLTTSSKTAGINKQASMSSWVNICAMEYRQLITTCTCANLSE